MQDSVGAGGNDAETGGVLWRAAGDILWKKFDKDAWTAELIALNPWAAQWLAELKNLEVYGLWEDNATPHKQNEWTRALTEHLVQARRQATLARWGMGRLEWNQWAEPMLKLKARLEQAGRWEKDADKAGPEQWRYRALAHTDFTELCLPGRVDFALFIFPGTVGFDETQFGDNEASRGDANFANAQFSGGAAIFSGAQFSGGGVNFAGSHFSGGAAIFSGAQFSGGGVNFTGSHFSGGGNEIRQCKVPRRRRIF